MMLPSSMMFMDSKRVIGAILAIVFIAGALGYGMYVNDRTQHAIRNQTESNTPSEIPTPLRDISNFDAIKAKYGISLTPAQEAYFEQNRFLLIDEDKTNLRQSVRYSFDAMLQDFDSLGGSFAPQNRKPEDAVLVTPDIVLHAYHRYTELTLEELEQKDLSDLLELFLKDIRTNLSQAYAQSKGSTRLRYMNLEGQIAIAQVLLANKNQKNPIVFDSPQAEEEYKKTDNNIDSVTNAKVILQDYSTDLSKGMINAVNYELEKIYAADSIDTSLLFGQYDNSVKTDYTQFTPRSHYADNSSLRAYFRTMMYLGRSAYSLKNETGLIDAALLTEQFDRKTANGTTPVDSWNRIMQLTTLYAGNSDDITYPEMHDFVTKTLNQEHLSTSILTPSLISQGLAGHLDQLRTPKILSKAMFDPRGHNKTQALADSLSFRIFGQRFAFDSWILNDLTKGQEQTSTNLPSMPSALFVPAAMGDDRAKEYVGSVLQKDSSFSTNQVKAFMRALDDKRISLGKVTNNEWFSSLNSAWLYVLGSLQGNYGSQYPIYMQSRVFPDKQIQTFLGSFAELKHDTLLYAKQSYDGLGGGSPEGTIPPTVKGYVEPNLEFWHRFEALVNHTQEVFEANGVLKDNPAIDRLQRFKNASQLFTDIATKELRNEPVSDDMYETLRTTQLGFMADPFGPIVPSEDSGKTAVIADIHTDPQSQKILYEATGKPYMMLVAVGNEHLPRIVAGIVYNHYELTSDSGHRLTDHDWRTWVYDQTDKLPLKNFWYNSLFTRQ